MSDAAIHPSGPATVPRPAQRWLSRLAFLVAGAAAVVPLAAAGVRGSLLLIGAAVAAVAAALVATWWFLTHRRIVRWLSAVAAVAALLVVAVLFARAEMVWVVVVAGSLWAAAAATGRAALGTGSAASAAQPEYETPAPRRPFLIMNPRSGGGKVARFDLVDRARALGAEVAVLEGTVDIVELARQAVRDGADLLGVAGGDGTQALVAGVAAEHGVPFMVISAGTRNHFALDLGLDRDDPSTNLDALSDGVEMRIDLGRVGDRTFVNNASFGAYAAVVQSDAYRDAKTATTLDLLPDLLNGADGANLVVHAGDLDLSGPRAVLVSNNPYAMEGVATLGRRYRLDGGILGVVALTVRGAADAARLVGGSRSRAFTSITADTVVVDADTPELPVGVDGEALLMPTPVRCELRPAALRVRVPRHRPGTPAPRPRLDWAALGRLALSTGRRAA
jgi:diacylglycerol kinase family enzyme